jgi:aryl-alcohol dehydrogenase-like predicted oxidoreductase
MLAAWTLSSMRDALPDIPPPQTFKRFLSKRMEAAWLAPRLDFVLQPAAHSRPRGPRGASSFRTQVRCPPVTELTLGHFPCTRKLQALRPCSTDARMEYRQLGKSGLRVSVLCLGTMTFGGRSVFSKVGSTDVDNARRQVDLCLEAGINLFDTADVYSEGVSEEILGEVLEGRRDDVLIATKARMVVGEGPNDGGVSRYHLIRSCEQSLRRLRTDRIDLYQLHEWDGETPLEEALEALDSLVHSGKVRYIGASNYSGWHLMKALATSEHHGYVRFVSQQIHYSLQARDAEYELVPISIDQGLGILVWSPLAGGLLSGKYRRGQQAPEGSRHLAGWGEPPIHNEDQLYNIVDALVEIGEARQVSAAQVALAYLLGRPGVTSVIIGARTEAQLADNLAAAKLTLTPEERERLDTVSAPVLLYPYWHQAKTAKERLSPADLTLLAPHIKRAQG